MINHITEFENRTCKKIIVFYESGRQRTFGQNDSLPNNVLDKYLNGKAQTTYTSTGRTTRIY